jgi:hypothetical protein
MSQNRADRVRNRWLRLAVGAALLAAAFAVLARGPLVPGAAGRVLEHNREHDLQTTALFYSDLERMPEIEARLARMRPGRAGVPAGP